MLLPKSRHLIPFICLGVRPAKPRRGGLQLLLQKGHVSCSSHGISVSPLQMFQTHQGSSNDTKCLCFVQAGCDSCSRLVED